MPEPLALRVEEQSFLDDLLGRRARSTPERAAVLRAFQDSVDVRFQIYASGLPARVVEALENDFPALARIVGPGPLRSLTARYLAAHTPRSYDLGRVGDRLARSLEGDPLTVQLPFLPDLARYEWAIAEAFVAADATPVSWADLAGLPAEAVADLRFMPLPGTRLVRSRWPLRALRATRGIPDADVSVPVAESHGPVLVHRAGLEVLSRDPDDSTTRLLEALSRGASLAEASEEWGSDQAVPAFRRLVEWRVLMRSVNEAPELREDLFV